MIEQEVEKNAFRVILTSIGSLTVIFVVLLIVSAVVAASHASTRRVFQLEFTTGQDRLNHFELRLDALEKKFDKETQR
jgi:hypothetical protein